MGKLMNLVSCKKIVGNRYFVFVVLAIFFLIGLNIYSKDKFLMNIDERTSNTVSIVSGEVYQQPLLNVRQFETGAFIVSLKRNAETGFNGYSGTLVKTKIDKFLNVSGSRHCSIEQQCREVALCWRDVPDG